MTTLPCHQHSMESTSIYVWEGVYKKNVPYSQSSIPPSNQLWVYLFPPFFYFFFLLSRGCGYFYVIIPFVDKVTLLSSGLASPFTFTTKKGGGKKNTVEIAQLWQHNRGNYTTPTNLSKKNKKKKGGRERKYSSNNNNKKNKEKKMDVLNKKQKKVQI